MALNFDSYSKTTQAVLNYFQKISQFPRPSRHEEALKDYLKQWASENQFTSKEDKIGNLLIEVPASKGRESDPTVVIQGHLDMVCEKVPESNHDFYKDPIRLQIDGDWLSAIDTSLGADNGIAIALAMAAVTDSSVSHPPLELLFTIDEETGLVGASELDPQLISGKVLLNIDSEEEGVLTIGCAGGETSYMELPVKHQAIKPNYKAFTLEAGGLKGGHSGVDIHKNRGSAILIGARILKKLSSQLDLALVDIKGGTAHNAIPRSSQSTFVVSDKDKLMAAFDELKGDFINEFNFVDKDIQLSIRDTDTVEKALDNKSRDQILDFLLALPNGIAAMSAQIEGLVETSNIVAKVGIEGEAFHIQTSQRSTVNSRLEMISGKIESIAKLSGAAYKASEGYPPWQPNWGSPLLEKSKKIYRELFDKDARIEVMHAGLECGIIGFKCPDLDMISFGPTIVDPHSPDERLKISDIDKIWKLLVALLV